MYKSIVCALALTVSVSAFAKTEVNTETNERGAVVITINSEAADTAAGKVSDAQKIYEAYVGATGVKSSSGQALIKKAGDVKCVKDGNISFDASENNSSKVTYARGEYGCRLIMNQQGSFFPAVDEASDMSKLSGGYQ